uniref:DNA polymerase delta small subunit n=1 Tax=Pyramimonas obovata TaxID=1411642 RepID=A0A7S0RED1_9CHLO|mmetsp:Transcript_32330/g.70567  ORF Transcript_32330/g.70567 Transcript_32330/m.70567 type:complete len:472 (+) Transcript_32330:190-1605(+)|eukprot:CAMPEP_0118931704 /NCGR_PEP_ID=MMETSP1169-20130426/7954_1 /TAXON_ID=36882 /ORGANISM="Pyramimonas obovata, Strain CCMP722" /LENGTH=471 /DNA_ID=CAMNT_0006874233 /DNA_START=188 /DNA_END=1603 /DNA_ORIENTATION=-
MTQDMVFEAPSAQDCDGFDTMLSARKDDAMEVEPMTRETSKYLNKSARFIVEKKSFKEQYAQLYFTRLMLTSPRVREAIKEKFPEAKVAKILDLEDGQECVIVGTLYKDMLLKPTILDEYTKERSVEPLVRASKLTSDSDTLVLEDEGARVRLSGEALDLAKHVTGIVVAVKGTAERDGNFTVSDVLYAPPGPQAAVPLPREVGAGTSGRYVALVSGLQLGGGGNPLPAQLLIDHLCGLLGSSPDQELSARVVRVVLAGDSFAPGVNQVAAGKLNKKQQADMKAPLLELDLGLAQLAAAMPVDVMPGPADFTNVSLPQQPMHRVLFPGAARYSTFQGVTNPYEFDCEDISFLGTSGQNVDDLYKYCDVEDRLDLLEATWRWQHLAPTAPDTLATYPFSDRDPFIVEQAPHVYFVGNQPEFATRVVTGPAGQVTRLLALPRFADSGMAVLVNLDTLACHPLVFSTEPLQADE